MHVPPMAPTSPVALALEQDGSRHPDALAAGDPDRPVTSPGYIPK